MAKPICISGKSYFDDKGGAHYIAPSYVPLKDRLNKTTHRKSPDGIVEIFIDLLNFKKEIREWSTMTTPFLAIRKYVDYLMHHSYLIELVNSKPHNEFFFNSSVVGKGAYSIMQLLLALNRECLMPPGIMPCIFKSGYFYYGGKHIKVTKAAGISKIPNFIAYNDGVYQI